MKTVCLALVVLFSFDCGITQAATPTARELKLANLQLQGMNDSLERLVSGIFRGVGTDYRAHVSDSSKRTRPINFFCAFDYSGDLLRFDRDTGEVVKIHREQLGALDYTDPLRVMYIRRPECSLHWSTEDRNAVKRKANNANPPRNVNPFDVRYIGLSFNSTLDRHRNYRDILESYSALKVVEVTETEEFYRICLLYRNSPDVFYTIWFNREQGGLPSRLEMCRGTLSSPPLQRSEIAWQHISNIWVPKTFMGEDYDSPGKLSRKMKLAFEWESVNQRIPEKYFTPEGMDLPPETRIVSYELGVRVELGTIGNSAL